MDARQNKQAQKSKPSLLQFLYKKIFESISVKEESTTLSRFLNNKSDVGLNLLFLKELKTFHWDILTRISWLHHTYYSAVNNPFHSSHLLLLNHLFVPGNLRNLCGPRPQCPGNHSRDHNMWFGVWNVKKRQPIFPWKRAQNLLQNVNYEKDCSLKNDLKATGSPVQPRPGGREWGLENTREQVVDNWTSFD